MKEKKPSIQVVVPVHGNMEPMTAMAVSRLMGDLLMKGYEAKLQFHMGESLISRGRCIIAHRFLESGYDLLMCIDADIVFNPEDVIKLIEHDKPVVGANYNKKAEGATPAGLPEDMSEPLSKARYLPTGFMLIKKEAFQQIIDVQEKLNRGHAPTMAKFGMELEFLPQFSASGFKDIWGFYIPYVKKEKSGHKWYLSEDWAFTDRLQKAGVDVYMDNMISLGHVGKKVY